MNIAIDFGNTSTKMGVFEGSEMLSFHNQILEDDIISILAQNNPSEIILSNVGVHRQSIVSKIEERYKLTVFSHKTPVPVTNQYATPNTLGLDRLAAVIGANELFPNENCLVIDMGTCITYDFISKEKEYLGGGISLGMAMRFKALNEFTANLPLLNYKSTDVNLIGNSTYDCIQSGVINGLKAELNGIIKEYIEQYKQLKVVLCGGDAKFFESYLKPFIFANHNLVLYGLNRILLSNEKNL